MAGPTFDFLNAANAAYQPSPPPNPGGLQVSFVGQPPPSQNFGLPLGGGAAPGPVNLLGPNAPPPSQPAPPPPQTSAPAPATPSHAPPASPPPAAGPSGAAPNGLQFPLTRLSGPGVVTVHAKETEMRGPTLLNAQARANQAAEGAIQAVQARNAEASAGEMAMYGEQARQAAIREDAAVASQAARDEELQYRQQDFDSSVRSLSKMSMDPDRFWATRSTGQKIGAMIGIALGGFVQGARGGSNVGMDVINQAIDRDLKAQEFAYNAAKDTAVAKQTAFGMAMQKYQNADQARAMARAAALDAVQAQLGQQAAMWKGTEAANRANIAMADLEAQKRNEIQQGIAFTPTHQVAVGATYVDPTTGLRYNENQAHDLAKEYRGYGEKLGEINAKGTQDAYLKAIEAAMKQNEDKSKVAREDAKFITQRMQDAGVPVAMAAAEQARQALMKAPLSVNEGVMSPLGLIAKSSPVVHKAMFGADAAEREQAWGAYMNAAKKVIFGNVTKDENDRANAEFEGAHDQASRMAAIKNTQHTLQKAIENIRKGASPEGRALYDQQTDVPDGAKPLSESVSSFRPTGTQ